jgi:hypothetical protein
MFGYSRWGWQSIGIGGVLLIVLLFVILFGYR